MKALLLATAALVLTSAGHVPASADPAGHGHGHGHADFSAGEPGDPKKPAKSISVDMLEADGKMLFAPDRLEVRRGQQVRFLLRNSGELEHEFVLGTTEDNLRHAEEMQASPDMGHDEPNGKRLEPNETGEIVWRFTKAGTFEFACLIPGHREAGMTGFVAVK